uniref:Uncharacterized protein n=1 Tax=Tanacetum cinerariifolium TaxID=118510 RepID=A0A6L2JUN7_TANCI|nr:hypothetical protein [Tanacetum cinerariifolium]
MLFVEYTRIKVKQFRETLLLHMGNVKKSVAKRTHHKRKTKSDEHITSSSSGTYITHVVDADIRPVNDQEPSVEVHLTAQHNVLANEQQHTNQSEPSYDTYLLEKVDSNTTPDLTNMYHRGGEIDQDAKQDQAKSSLLKAEFLKTNDMVETEKCVFNVNHDDCITKFLKEVNCHAKVQSLKSRNNIKPAKRILNVNKSERWISKGYRFSPNKSFAVYEKPNTPRSCLRWKPTGRNFKIVGLRWIPTGKMFIDCTTKADSEPLNVQASLFIDKWHLLATLQVPLLKEKTGVRFSALYLQKKRNLLVFDHSRLHSSYFPMLIQPLILAAAAAPRAIDPVGSPSSPIIDQDVL